MSGESIQSHYFSSKLMPTVSISTSLLILGKSEGMPWTSASWQTLTNVIGPPWDTPTGAAPDSISPNTPEWTVGTASSVKAYAQNLWARSGPAQIKYASRGYAGNDTDGRNTWNAWVQAGIRRWRLNRLVDDMFNDCKLSPYDAMARAKQRTVSGTCTRSIDSI